MNVTIKPGRVCGAVEVITSKSFAHRALLCAALASLNGGETALKDVNDSDDVNATVGALAALGFIFRREGGTVTFQKTDKASLNQNAVIDCRESGSTLRFILPVAAALGVNAEITGTKKLLSRPLDDLIGALTSHGITVFRNGERINISGKLTGGVFNIAGNVSSQFVTGLMLAAPLLVGGAEIRIYEGLVSEDYVWLTANIMGKFGILFKSNAGSFFKTDGGNAAENKDDDGLFKTDGGNAAENQTGGRSFFSLAVEAVKENFNTYRRSLGGKLTVEADWSNAAFPLAAGAVAGDKGGVTVSNAALSTQGDIRILGILERSGAAVDFHGIGEWYLKLVGSLELSESYLGDDRENIGAKAIAKRFNESRHRATVNEVSEGKVAGGGLSNDSGLYPVTAAPKKLKAFKVDAENIPDMVPILSVLAANARGKSVITNVNRLCEKESNRLAAIMENLTTMGGKISYDESVPGGALYIKGGKLKGAVLKSHNDHRMVMSAAVAALTANGETTILDAEAVNKSYPGFFDMMKSLGASITVSGD
ncbi:MAG: 3-phosphoshikimate 1-carboxyvinyltransferase [Clostridiaceae bacterium]|jgi:3-phosphoshikimate 1-carboxyvinyltransferase|nr:3-phosphoshikimate 1-carboxyvinyltransferase [Clostridiaceae bacterium]